MSYKDSSEGEVRMAMHICIPMSTNAYMGSHKRAHVATAHAHDRPHASAQVHAYARAYEHTQAHTHTGTFMHPHACTHLFKASDSNPYL